MVLSSFTLPGGPRTKKNSQRIIRLGNRYSIRPSEAFEKYQTSLAKHVPFIEAISTPCQVSVTYYMDTHRKVDLGNLLAATCDILVHYNLLADDNSKIVVSHDGSRVLYDKENPRAEVIITSMDEQEGTA